MSNRLELVIRKTVADQLHADQVARIFKVPEELQQTPCDFFGYTASGRAILIEAKMVSSRVALPINGSPGLAKHQWNELGDANRANAIALIAWARKDKVAVISYDQAHAYSEKILRKSIPWGSIPNDYKRDFRPSEVVGLIRRWLPVSEKNTGHVLR